MCGLSRRSFFTAPYPQAHSGSEPDPVRPAAAMPEPDPVRPAAVPEPGSNRPSSRTDEYNHRLGNLVAEKFARFVDTCSSAPTPVSEPSPPPPEKVEGKKINKVKMTETIRRAGAEVGIL